ncbi:MAG: hypothetical protein JWM44_1989 [Bacilli bacterium]|nr:hypothetical protein [Bacilli bacterium]
MEIDRILVLTRFLVKAGKAVQNKGNRLTEHITVLQEELEKLDEAIDDLFSKFNDDLHKEIFALYDLPELDQDGKFIQGRAQDVLSKYFFNDDTDLETCLDEFHKELALIKQRLGRD